MGRIINLDSSDGELPKALTRTGGGGFLSRGYLGDEPAMTLVENDETVQFVVTNRKRGVTVESPDTSSQLKPDSDHRTVVVVTDRRLVVLVGRGDGDERRITSLVDVADVGTTTGRRNGRLTVSRTDDTTWQIPTDTDGLDDVASYLREAAAAWRQVDSSLTTVESRLAEAHRLQAAGEYDGALTTARETQGAIEDARSQAAAFSRDNPGNALLERAQAASAQRHSTIATIRLARARDAAATGDRLFRSGNYEPAREALERAGEEYEAALAAGKERLDDPKLVLAERRHVTTLASDIEESPLAAALTADRAAVEADEPARAAAHWETALTQYRAALRDGDSLFHGDPDQLRNRIETVAESLTAAQRTVAEEARRAGDWYADAEQYEAALEEFAAAEEEFEAAMATATESYPDAVPHLEADLEALRQRIDRARSARDGEDPEVDRIDSDDGPSYEVSATIGDVGEPTEIAAAIEPSATDSGAEPTVERLERLDATSTTSVVSDALDADGWTTQVARPRTPFDLIATREGERLGVVVSDGAVTADAVAESAEVTGAAGTDAVMLATTASLPEDAEREAARRGVRLFDGPSLAAVVDAENLTLPAPVADPSYHPAGKTYSRR